MNLYCELYVDTAVAYKTLFELILNVVHGVRDKSYVDTDWASLYLRVNDEPCRWKTYSKSGFVY